MPPSVPSTPFANGSLRNGRGEEASPAELLKHLETLIAEHLNDNSTDRIPASDKENWTTIIDGLSDHFISKFPRARSLQWNALHEKIKLCTASLVVIERAAQRVETLFEETDKRSVVILYQLLRLVLVLQSWSLPALPNCNNFDSPYALRTKAIETIKSVLKSFASSSAESAVLGLILQSSLTVISDVLSQMPTAIWPLKFVYLDLSSLSNMDESGLEIGIEISDFAMSCIVLTDLLSLAVASYEASTQSCLNASMVDREIVATSRSLLDLLLSSETPLAKPQRFEAIVSLIQSVRQLHSCNNAGRDILSSILTSILVFRLREGAGVDWQLVDASLRDCFQSGSISVHPQNSTILILELVLREGATEDNQPLVYASTSAIQASLEELEHRNIEAIRQLLIAKEATGAFRDLLRALDVTLHSPAPQAPDAVLGKRKWDDDACKQRVIQILQANVFGSEQGWIPGDDFNDAIWITNVLDSVRKKLTEPLVDASEPSKVKAMDALKAVACIFAHPDEKDCSKVASSNQPPLLALIPICVACLSRLLEGTGNEVTPLVTRSAYDTLAVCLRHHTQGFSEEKFDVVGDLIHQGMQNQDRLTRLAAGRALVELIRLYKRIGLGRGVSKRLNAAFEIISTLFTHKRDSVKETTLVSLGIIGKTADMEVLGKALFILFTQLDQNSILLRGSAYLQLLGLAKFHKKTSYLLISPFMEQISIYVVSIMPQRSNALHETCQFLSQSPNDFLSMTLQYTLPPLFAACNSAALESIQGELGKSVSTLFLNTSPDILAHVFLLKTSSETDKALSFILRTLSSAANNAKIGLANVVKSCIVPLLGKLVIAMGDENLEEAENAMQAIRKVERTLSPPANTRHSSVQHIGSFLKPYMLGIIAQLNDVLQDVQGRKTDDMKRKVLFGLNALIKEVGTSISAVAPQIMATLQTTVCLVPLSYAAIQTWHSFAVTLSLKDLGPHVGPTTATLVNIWPSLRPEEQAVAKRTIDYILNDAYNSLGEYANDIVDFSIIPEIQTRANKVRSIKRGVSVKERLERILERTYSDNNTVVIQALQELKSFMQNQHGSFVQNLASGDVFDPLVGHIMKALLAVACRDGENIEPLRLLAFECLGILGAADPDRFDIQFPDDEMIVLGNYKDENEAMNFAKHLIQNTLVGAFRSTSDLKYQGHLAFAIQELLRFCKFTPDLAIPGGAAVPLKIRNRWTSLPKHVLETVTPLLDGKFAVSNTNITVNLQHPIYPGQATYREWLQLWTAYLITQATGEMTKAIFNSFRLAVRNKDVGVAHQLLPHLVLNILISGPDDATQKIQAEIVAVLNDQLDAASSSSSDKRLLSAQAIFMLMDHLNKWIRVMRQQINMKRNERRRTHHDPGPSEAELEVTRVDSVLTSIDQDLIAKAAFQCKAYARSLMNFEKQIFSLTNSGTPRDDLQAHYDRLHEIYAHLDEPDGMEGIAAYVSLPSIEHQIRQHESTGRWTSAQSCWEVRLQQSPDNLDYHLGLLRCLRNLGHYDSLRTHIQGILVRNPEWENALSGFRVEGAWMSGDWNEVQRIVEGQEDTWETAVARLLLALRSSDDEEFAGIISATRLQLGVPVSAAGERGYRRAYDAILQLHLVRDIETIRNSIVRLNNGGSKVQVLPELFLTLSTRLDATLPTFRTREPILSIHRTAFSLSQVATGLFKRSIGRAWLDSAKIARKAGHWQTAYSAILQAQECRAPLTFYQSAKLVKASGEPLRALYELENALKTSEERRQFLTQGVIDLTEDASIDDSERKRGEAKAKLLRAKWMIESERFDVTFVAKELSDLARTLSEYESAHFHAGHFQDECFKALSTAEKRTTQGPKMNLYTVKSYAIAMRLGSKYAYQTIPRLLTIWLDMGEDDVFASCDSFSKINEEVQKAINRTPVYKWLTAFPQIVSRVDHKNPQAFNVLSNLIVTVLQEYPQQGLWLFVSVVQSTKSRREKRGRAILEQLKNNPRNANTAVPSLINHAVTMSTELLKLCDHPIRDEATKSLNMAKDFPVLAKLVPSPLIIPLQESMIVSLPATSGSESGHQPFPPDAPTISAFFDEIDVLKSLAKPRKITLKGSDGRIYMFLGKPKDDLRKDARLMDFNSIINKLLRTNSESRRRQLRIRTYSVVTLNEECGFIQWVPNTTPIRPILLKYYSARGIEHWSRDMTTNFQKIKDATDKEAAKIFKEKVLSTFPPLFHEWFLDTFPEPTAWLSSRLAYGRTLAVMSMVGFILGLGDRHLENILLDVNSGDAVHVDFNCLFEKGKTLEIPERVPFRLTSNLIDALGVTGVEGVFRNASEITLQLLRDNKDILMSVLDAFIHDPLVEWEDEKRKMERKARRAGDINAVKESVNLRNLAKTALTPIERKLRGMYTKDTNRNDRKDKEISTSNLVQMLIEEATDLRNLAKMYPGWAPWH